MKLEEKRAFQAELERQKSSFDQMVLRMESKHLEEIKEERKRLAEHERVFFN